MPEENKKDEGKIVMETNMHSEACRFKVYKTIVRYPGVEDVSIDLKGNKVTLKAPKVDAKKLFETVKKKSRGKITKLVYPDPNEKKKEEKKEEKKPVEVTVVLKVNMDCTKCTQKVEKAAWSLKDVHNVKANDHILTVKGWNLDPTKICKEITKKSRKHAEIVPLKKEGDKKEGDKKDGDPKKEEKEAPKIVVEYIYPPQYFSDENPNACVLM